MLHFWELDARFTRDDGQLHFRHVTVARRKNLSLRVSCGAAVAITLGTDLRYRKEMRSPAMRLDMTFNPASDRLAGKPSRTIAMALNREGVAGPQGKERRPTTIHGNPKPASADWSGTGCAT